MEGYAAKKTSNGQVHLTVHKPPRFDINDPSQAEAMVAYAVVAAVASPEEIEHGKRLFWEFCKHNSPELRQDDITTWIDSNWIASPTNGIVFKHSSEHCDFAWHARLLPGVKKAFQLIWGSDELVVSFDRINAFRPWKYNPSWITNGNWWHLDQNAHLGKNRRGRVCVQGLITLTDVNEETGGLCIIPESHRHHQAICDRTPGAHSTKSDFFKVDSDDPVLQASGLLLCASAGDLVLWDSRVVHCNTPALTYAQHLTTSTDAGISTRALDAHCTADAQCAATTSAAHQPPAAAAHDTHDTTPGAAAAQPPAVGGGDSDSAASGAAQAPPELLRLAAYVCMVPRRRLTEDVRLKRQVAFVHAVGRGTHWPDKAVALPHVRSLRSLGPARDVTACPPAMLELVGYTAAEIARLRVRTDTSAAAAAAAGVTEDSGAWGGSVASETVQRA